MPYVQIPRDLNKIKEKFLFGLPKRQVIYFGIGIAVGIVPFFVLMKIDITAAVVALMCCILPFGFMGMYEKNGYTCDKLIMFWLKANLFSTKLRPYKTENIYAALEQQYNIDKEVQKIGYKKSTLDKFIDKLEAEIVEAGKPKIKKSKQ